MRNRTMMVVATVLALGGTMAATATPAAAWCRWGRCGGYGYGGWGWRGGWGAPVAAGLVAGAVVGTAAASAARPYPPYAPGGYFVCPPGYHFGPAGRACWSN